MHSWGVGLALVLLASAFAAMGVLYARRHHSTLEDYITARVSVCLLRE